MQKNTGCRGILYIAAAQSKAGEVGVGIERDTAFAIKFTYRCHGGARCVLHKNTQGTSHYALQGAGGVVRIRACVSLKSTSTPGQTWHQK